VIALGRGGVLESASGGFFYREPEEEQLEDAIRRFEAAESAIMPHDLQASVTRFSEAEFAVNMGRVLGFHDSTSRRSPSTPPAQYAAES